MEKYEGMFLAGEFAQEFLFVHAVFECFSPVDEDDGDFIVELAAKVGVGVHINFTPGEAAAARELGEALLHYLAEMTALARIYDDAARIRHAGRFYRGRIAVFQQIVILRRV